MKDYYYILGLDKKAEQSDVKRAYRKLSMKFHPDKNPGDSYFENRFKDIQEAYEVLSNQQKRTKYDSEFATFAAGGGGQDFINELRRKYEETLRKKVQSYKDELKKSKKEFERREREFASSQSDLHRRNQELSQKVNKNNSRTAKRVMLGLGMVAAAILSTYFINMYQADKQHQELESEMDVLIQNIQGTWRVEGESIAGQDRSDELTCLPEFFVVNSSGKIDHYGYRPKRFEKSYQLGIENGQVSLSMGTGMVLSGLQVDSTKSAVELTGEGRTGTYKYTLSRRGIFEGINSKQQSLSEFKSRMEVARREIDDNEEYCDGIIQMLNCGILSGNDSQEYIAGRKIALCMAYESAKFNELQDILIQEILESNNEQFKSIEYATNDAYESGSGIRARFWMYGYTHPTAELSKFYLDQSATMSEVDRVNYMKSFAQKYYKYSWGRLESSTGSSYADLASEYIYYECDVDWGTKKEALSELASTIEGSGKGNALFCLFLLHEGREYYWNEQMQYLSNSLSVFESLPPSPFHREMIELIQDKLALFDY